MDKKLLAAAICALALSSCGTGQPSAVAPVPVPAASATGAAVPAPVSTDKNRACLALKEAGKLKTHADEYETGALTDGTVVRTRDEKSVVESAFYSPKTDSCAYVVKETWDLLDAETSERNRVVTRSLFDVNGCTDSDTCAPLANCTVNDFDDPSEDACECFTAAEKITDPVWKTRVADKGFCAPAALDAFFDREVEKYKN